MERMIVRELLAEWRGLNVARFRAALRPPVIELSEAGGFLGRWILRTRRLELSREFVLSSTWGTVIEVLKHEMAHQYAHEVLKATDETAHGPAFRQVCERMGIDAAAAGIPASPATEKVVERISRLLALAGSPNQHEAEAAALAAQRLMLKHNIDEAHAKSERSYAFRQMGSPNGRVGEAERILAMILAKHFFVEVIWVPAYRVSDGKRGSVLEICGTPANLAMAEYVHAYLTHTSEQLWRDHKKLHEIQGDRDRRTFLAGVMAGFADKLARDHKTHREAGLVWVGDKAMGEYFRRRHPHVRNVRHGGRARTEAYGHGREAGKSIVLRRGVDAAPAARGRLLGR
jgi:predicted SprT family Zn-dependent metalloprotease